MRNRCGPLIFLILTFSCFIYSCYSQNTLNLVTYSKKFGIGYRICVDKDYVYMTNNKGLEIIDVRQPEKPKKVSLVPTGVSFGICVKDSMAYISGRGGLIIADIRDPENPEIINEYVLGVETRGIQVKDHHAYITSDRGLEILDTSDPSRISRIAHVGNDGMRAVEICDNIAYLAAPGRGVYVVDVTDPISSQVITSLAGTKGAWNLHLHDEFLYVARHGEGISIFDISDKKHPRLLGSFRDDDQGEAQGVWGDGRYLFVSDNYGIEVLDVTDPGNPYEIDEYASVRAAHDICSDGNYIYVASASKGFMVLEFSLTANKH